MKLVSKFILGLMMVKLFREKYPNIHVQLRNVTGRDGLAMIRDDEVDFAVGSMLDVPSDINYQPVFSFEPALIILFTHHPFQGRNQPGVIFHPECGEHFQILENVSHV